MNALQPNTQPTEPRALPSLVAQLTRQDLADVFETVAVLLRTPDSGSKRSAGVGQGDRARDLSRLRVARWRARKRAAKQGTQTTDHAPVSASGGVTHPCGSVTGNAESVTGNATSRARASGLFPSESSTKQIELRPDTPVARQAVTLPVALHAASTEIRWSPNEGWTGITNADRREWTEAFTTLALDVQLARMSAWLRANPQKAHKSNWRRFIVNWLIREQNGGPTPISSQSSPASRPRASSIAWANSKETSL